MTLGHGIDWALLILTPIAAWKLRWHFPCLLPMLTFSVFSGAAVLDGNYAVAYHPLTISVTLTFQCFAVAESVWLLTLHNRSRLEASLCCGFACLVGLSLVLWFAASNPEPYGAW